MLKFKWVKLVQVFVFVFFGSILNIRAQSDFVPPLSGSALTQWQIQGEYFGALSSGGDLGAWLIANGNDSYTIAFLPGGLLTLPGKPYGGWVQAGWNRNNFSGSAKLTGTDFSVTTGNNYKTTTLTGIGESRSIKGQTPSGATFTLNRVVRNSPTFRLRPQPAWGTATLLFDSATGQADLTKWENKDNQVQLSRKFLYRGVQTVAGQGSGLLHIEFQGCFNPTASGQGRSNSGIYLQGHYEAQVLDSFGNGGAIDEFGAIYSVNPPSVNAALPPLTWHTYDIYFTSRTSGGAGDDVGAATMTVYSNGVLTQSATPVKNVTTAGVNGNLLVPGQLYLQNHGNEVVYNNIWFIPNATLTSLPYETILSSVTVGLKPLPTHRPLNFGWNFHTNFNLNGRALHTSNTTHLK